MERAIAKRASGVSEGLEYHVNWSQTPGNGRGLVVGRGRKEEREIAAREMRKQRPR
jgi:hypothetical protein